MPAMNAPLWRVEEVIIESPTVKTFRFVPLSRKSRFKFTAGQYANVTVNIDGETVNRPYSISSASSHRQSLDLSIKREPQGKVSGYMHDHVQAGDTLELSGPFGDFHCSGKGVRSIVLLGSGVGVTPLISMIRSLSKKNWPGKITAIFGFRHAGDTLFAGELLSLAAASPNFDLVLAYSGKGLEPGGVYKVEAGRVTPDLVAKYLPDLTAHSYYCCGPDQMMKDIEAGLIARGVPAGQYNSESFCAPEIDLSKGGEFEIDFVKSGTKATSRPGETILLTAERVGVKIPSACRAGTCMLCQSTLQNGEIEIHNADALDDDDLESGALLTCQSYPRNSCQIDA